MTIDFEPDEMETAVSDAMAGLCRQHCPDSLPRGDGREFPAGLWAALCEFGLFGLAVPGDGGALAMTGAAIVLGGAVAPGPLAAGVFAAAVLPPAEREAVVSGASVAVLCADGLVPWPDRANLFLGTDGDVAWRWDLAGSPEALETLAGEPWARTGLKRAGDLGSARRACAAHDAFLAGYLCGGARKLLQETSAYVSTRRQFGKTLSQFQAVTHPLADAAIRVRSATILARIAAHEIDQDETTAFVTAARARLSAETAAMKAAYVAHQSYGAMGMTVEGPVYYVSRRLRQLVNQRYGEAARMAALDADMSPVPSAASALERA